jgi:linalool 8-monooxygenase
LSSTTIDIDLSRVDLSEADEFEAGPPHEIFKRMRADAPVHFNHSRDEADFWSITRHADVMAVTGDEVTFSSASPIAFMHDEKSIIPIEVLQGMMVNMDPPKHSRYRKVVRASFTPKAMAQFEPTIRALCTELVDNIVERGECDFVDDLAVDLPIAAICAVLGIPDADRRQLFNWTNVLIGAQDPMLRGSDETLFTALGEIGQYTAELVADRQQNPRDDLLTKIITAEIDGERLEFEELVSFFILLFGAGNETSRNSLSLGMRALIENTEQRAILAGNPDLLPQGVDEIFRYVTPLMHFRRTATRNTEIAGQPIAAGEKVVMWYASANRDERVFEEPDRFDVNRDTTGIVHTAFGSGIHKCLGQHLARLELVSMYRELLARIPDMELTGDVEYLRSNLFYGLKRMPVSFTPSSKTAS